jgi:hypothetical protein
VLAAVPLQAQSEADLKRHFEGKRVTLKIAMPGTEQGVDIYPGTDRPLDYPRYADRLKDHGTAIRPGDQAMITRIRVKGRHIEFQLDGGGYGTMSDETSSGISVPVTPKSKREKNLEAEREREKDPARKRELNEELDDLRSAREREDARNRAEVADAEEQKKQNIRQRRLEGGSRFNVRYRDRLPAAVLTPAGLEAALADYVSFDEQSGDTTATAGRGPAPRPIGLPRKGMLAREVEEMLGQPLSTSERDEGSLRVVTRTYRAPDGGVVTAQFVDDVLFRYSVTSN